MTSYMKTTNNYSDIHVSFDLDGTIIDSINLMQKSWQNATQKLNIQCDFSEYSKFIGLPFNVILEKLGLTMVLDGLSREYFSFNSKNMHLVKLNPTYQETISYLDRKNISWSIITSKPKKNTLALLDYFNINCPYVICPEDVKKGKPYPDSIEKLRRDAKIKNSKIIYVGDMLSDLQFAINSKITYVHYTNGIEKKFNKNLVSNCIFINNLIDVNEIIEAV